jgi:hypothetical protein
MHIARIYSSTDSPQLHEEKERRKKKTSTPQASRGSKETKKTQNTCKLHTFSIRFLLEEIHILVRSLDTTFALLSSSSDQTIEE